MSVIQHYLNTNVKPNFKFENNCPKTSQIKCLKGLCFRSTIHIFSLLSICKKLLYFHHLLLCRTKLRFLYVVILDFFSIFSTLTF